MQRSTCTSKALASLSLSHRQWQGSRISLASYPGVDQSAPSCFRPGGPGSSGSRPSARTSDKALKRSACPRVERCLSSDSGRRLATEGNLRHFRDVVSGSVHGRCELTHLISRAPSKFCDRWSIHELCFGACRSLVHEAASVASYRRGCNGARTLVGRTDEE